MVKIIERERADRVPILLCARFEVRRERRTGHIQQWGVRPECLASPRVASIGQHREFTQVLGVYVQPELALVCRVPAV